MKVAAYQAPLLAAGSMEVVGLIREQVVWCEGNGVEILCCPEAVLGGLADYSRRPTDFAIDVASGRLDRVLAPLASDTVTTIVGFTEIDRAGSLYNAAALFHRGSVAGIYRKLHPAKRRSIYAAGDAAPVFTVGDLSFGIIICRDSTYAEPAQSMVSPGAAALFVPTNNGLPPGYAGPELVDETRALDVAMAIERGVSVIRADVAGQTDTLVAHGSSGIVDSRGNVLGSARQLVSALIVADIDTTSQLRQRGRVSRSTDETRLELDQETDGGSNDAVGSIR